MQALALSPDQVPDNLTLQVEAVRPDGSRTPVIRFNTRPDWKRRYWFARNRHSRKGRRSRSAAPSTIPISSPRRSAVRSRPGSRRARRTSASRSKSSLPRAGRQRRSRRHCSALPAEARRIWRIRRRSNAAAAVDFEDDAGDEARFVGCEEHHGVGDVARGEQSRPSGIDDRNAARCASGRRRQTSPASALSAGPGQMALTRIRSGASSIASDLLSTSAAPLAGVVGGQVRPRPNGRHRHGVENHPAALPPHHRHRVALAARNIAFALTAIRRSNSCSSVSAIGVGGCGRPALLTTMSRRRSGRSPWRSAPRRRRSRQRRSNEH